MHPLQTAAPEQLSVRSELCFGQCQYTSIRDGLTLDQSDPPQLRQRSQLLDADVCQTMTAGEIDVADPTAKLDELDDGVVGDLLTVAQVDIM